VAGHEFEGRNLKKGVATGLLLCALLACLPAKTASADTLMQALAKAYQGNPNLAAEQANLRSLDESLPQALALAPADRHRSGGLWRSAPEDEH
jgi:hypothetical protein